MTTSSIAQINAIRPLEERQLRMFKRTLGPPQPEKTRISMPDWGGVELVISSEELHPISFRAKISLARKIARAYGGRLATAMEAIMSRTFMEIKGGADGGLFCIDYVGVPPKKGYYFINRKERRFEPITWEQAEMLPSTDNLYVKDSAADAVKERRLMRIYSLSPPHVSPGIDLSGTLHFDIPVGIVLPGPGSLPLSRKL